MHETIKSLWWGNCRTGERYFRKDSEYGRLAKRQTELADALREKLNSEEREMLEKILNISAELSSVSEEELFVDAFQLGARLAMEILTDYQGQFYT